MKTGTIYGLICPIQKKVLYIGKTTGVLFKRLGQHKCPKPIWKNSALNVWLDMLHAKGLIDQLTIVHLEENIPTYMLDEREMFAIELYSKTRVLLNTKGTDRKVKYKKGKKRNLHKFYPLRRAI